jgi:hypothetical protein
MVLWCLYRDLTTAVGIPKTPRFRRTLWFAGTTLGLTVASALILSAGENNHFFFYILGAQSGHEIRWEKLPYFIWNDLVFALPFAVVAIAGWCWRTRDRVSLFFYFAFLAGAVVSWIVPRAKVGGAMNNLIPLHACLIVFLGVAVGELLKSESRRGWVAPTAAACLALQFLWLAFDPRIALPRPGESDAGERFIRRLAATNGEVLMPAHGYLAGLASKRVYAHQMPVDDLSRSGLPGAEMVRDEFARAISEQRFELIVDSTSRFLETYPNDQVLKANYRPAGPVFKEADMLVPRSGWRVSPGLVWVPRNYRP